MTHIKSSVFNVCGRWPHHHLPPHFSTPPHAKGEGEKLIMTCHSFLRLISARPLSLLSLLQGYLLAHNQQQGVIISNHSLVIQGVSRTTAGNYSCVGFNAEGQGNSPPFQLNVLCKCESPFRQGVRCYTTPADDVAVTTSSLIYAIRDHYYYCRCTDLCAEPGPCLRDRETRSGTN